MKDGLVSVVIPVYNVEKLLDRCMDSVVNQTYRNIEIIMVDDGSPDSCPQKCEEWAKKDSRIKVIHKANAGLGMARNTGIENATGEYICFFDSDDYVAQDTVGNALALAKRDASDLVLFGMNIVDADGTIQRSNIPFTEKECYEGSEILNFVLPNAIEGSAKQGCNYNLNMSACTCLFSMSLIKKHDWRFVSEREYISEDYYSLLQLYGFVKKVSVLKQACYYYCFNNASLTHVFRIDRYERICHCYRAMMEMTRACGYPKEIEESLAAQYFGNVIGAMKMVIKAADLSYAEKVRHLREMVESQILQNAVCLTDFTTEPVSRKVLICAIKMKCTAVVYLLVKVKSSVGA